VEFEKQVKVLITALTFSLDSSVLALLRVAQKFIHAARFLKEAKEKLLHLLLCLNQLSSTIVVLCLTRVSPN
jgi:hypothetical protein